MKIEECLESRPTQNEVIKIICKTCNYDQISIIEMEDIKLLCDKFNLNINNFYCEGSDYEKYYVGVYRWNYKS